MRSSTALIIGLVALQLHGCSSSPPTLADQSSPVGAPCPAIAGASHSGEWGGSTTWLCGDPIVGEVAGYDLSPSGGLHIGICDAMNAGFGGECNTSGGVHIRVAAATVGVHEIDGTTVVLRQGTDAATTGEIEILGYDPMTRRVCARYDVRLSSGFEMRGELNAPSVCSP